MFASLLASTGLGLLSPLILRDLIDNALPHKDYGRLNVLAGAMIVVPILSGLVGVLQRYLNSTTAEGIIYDLRRALYVHMQRMSLRFLTSTRGGEKTFEGKRFQAEVLPAGNLQPGFRVAGDDLADHLGDVRSDQGRARGDQPPLRFLIAPAAASI